ncbi:MAG: BON domain-containing protein [Planctomycetaceae bacterium]|nr:BON domain-containing protein [Planctomycetales bacterium]MCB9921657.1 BON domain-containing protein [Planctomycetaceae bacterium]
MKTSVHLQRDILDELDWEPSIDAAHIGVTTNDGVVTLSGHVPVYAEKQMAEQVTKRVHGVRAVANEIEVRPVDAHVRDDEDIASAAVHALEWDAKVPHERVQISVGEGWITAEGTVEQQYQKAAVDRVLRHLVGLRGVTNNIVVIPREMTDEMKERIMSAFARSAVLRARDLTVEVEGSTVVLTGDAHTHAELEEAERIAWDLGNAACVQNCITLTPWGFGPAEEWGY